MINKKFLAIITARSGSKGLKNKNLCKIDNKPLISFPILAALKSKYIEDVVVSTDSKEIAKIAKKFGAIIPFKRPSNLSKDRTPSSEVVIHCLNYFKKKEINYKYFILLEPTSPFTEHTDIDKAISMIIKKTNADSIVGVSKAENSHPNFLSKINSSGVLSPYKKKFGVYRRQDISNLYFFDGSFYISKVKTYLKKKTFYHNKTLGLIMPKWKSFEVDTIFDLIIMRTIYKNRKKFSNEY